MPKFLNVVFLLQISSVFVNLFFCWEMFLLSEDWDHVLLNYSSQILNSVWAVSIFLSICHYCWDSSNHFLYAQNKISAIKFKKLPVKHSKGIVKEIDLENNMTDFVHKRNTWAPKYALIYSTFCLTWSSGVASFHHSSWKCTIKWWWLE